MTQTLDAVLAKGQTMPEKNRFPAVLQPSLYESHPHPIGLDEEKNAYVDLFGTLMARMKSGGFQGVVAQPSLYESHPNDSRVTGPVEQCPTVSVRWGTGGDNTPLVQQPMCLMDQGGSVMQVNTDGTTGTLRRETHGHEPVVVVQQPMAFTYSGYSNQPAWMTGSRTDCLSASGHSDGSHQGIGIVQSGEASAFSWQCRGDMRGMVPRPTPQPQRCQIEAVMVPDVAHTLRGEGFDAGEDGTGRGTPIVPIQTPAMHVRRLTPVECERLQGFPDGWTDIRPNGKDTPDSPRYKALGNSMAVPVMRWIGMRIAQAIQ